MSAVGCYYSAYSIRIAPAAGCYAPPNPQLQTTTVWNPLHLRMHPCLTLSANVTLSSNITLSSKPSSAGPIGMLRLVARTCLPVDGRDPVEQEDRVVLLQAATLVLVRHHGG